MFPIEEIPSELRTIRLFHSARQEKYDSDRIRAITEVLMTKGQKFRLDKNSRILGLHMKPGFYTPKALAKEMNRVLEADGRSERFSWNEKIHMFARSIPPPKTQSRLRGSGAAARPK